MNRTWRGAIRVAIAMSFVLLALACAAPETESEEPAAEPAATEEAAAEDSMDATVVASDHYTVEFENDRVRVVRINYGPGESAPMHSHPDHLTVFLTDLNTEFVMADGTTEAVSMKARSHIYLPAGQHQPRSTGDQALEAVAVELKASDSAEPSAAGDDPVVVDPDHYTAEFENDRVRVLRISYGPGESSVMHYHPEGVAVFLDDHHVRMEMPDGSSQEIHTEAGEHVFVEAGQHLPTNIGEEAWELVLVELK